MLTVGVTGRDETRRDVCLGERTRSRLCGKVRQYEETCRWSVSPVQSVENHSFFALSFRLFVFVSCAPGNLRGLRARTLSKHRETRLFRERSDDSWSSRAISPEPFDKSYNIVCDIVRREEKKKSRLTKEIGRRIDIGRDDRKTTMRRTRGKLSHERN